MSPAGNSMLDLFKVEAETHIAALNQGLLALEENPGSGEILNRLMRSAHSIKGAARIVKIGSAVTVAHRLEDVFTAAQKSQLNLSAEDVDILLKGVQILLKISKSPETDLPSEELDGIVSAIDSVRNKSSGTPPAAPAREKTTAAQKTPAPPPGIPEKQAPSCAPAAPARAEEAAVRMSATELVKLMDLAGESLLRARRLMPFADSLAGYKKRVTAVASMMEKLRALSDEKDSTTANLMEAIHGEMEDIKKSLHEKLTTAQDYALDFENLADRLYRTTLESRMRPFSDGIRDFPLMIRDLARQLGKKVRLEISGEDTRVDRDILEKLKAPLTHLLRNAIDHGLEMSRERAASGKSETGTIRLSARHQSGLLMISVQDDGQGVDTEVIRRAVVERKMINPEAASGMKHTELLEFLFLPGFSTSGRVTEISGRGVGLDIVRNMMKEVGGSVKVSSEKGHGAEFTLSMPVTLSVVRTMIFELCGEKFGVRLTDLRCCLKTPESEAATIEDRMYIHLGDENVAVISARWLFRLPPPQSTGELNLLVAGTASHSVGILVDRVIEEHDLVIRPLDPRLGKTPFFSATAVGDDGLPILLLNVDDVIAFASAHAEGSRQMKAGPAETGIKSKGPKRILVVDDSITVRETEKRMLENRGYTVDVAVDGLDGWNTLALHQYDMVITDVDMPRMNGLELTSHIRADSKLGRLPIVIVSYKDRPEDKEAGMRAGASYYLTKGSFDDESLLKAVDDLIGEPTT